MFYSQHLYACFFFPNLAQFEICMIIPNFITWRWYEQSYERVKSFYSSHNFYHCSCHVKPHYSSTFLKLISYKMLTQILNIACRNTNFYVIILAQTQLVLMEFFINFFSFFLFQHENHQLNTYSYYLFQYYQRKQS